MLAKHGKRLSEIWDHSYRFWATYRKVLDKNHLDFMASRLRFQQSNRKCEIETRHTKVKRGTQNETRFFSKT